jgi:hypothetical protein
MENMFNNSCFNGDISEWGVTNDVRTTDMFYKSRFSGQLPTGIKGDFK